MLIAGPLALLVGSKPRSKGMERKDLIKENGPIFTGQGSALSDRANADCRVLVVGNPCNTNCLIAQKNADKLKPEHFSAMTRLDHNRAMAQLAEKSGAHSSDIKNVVIWGNHSNTQYPDYHHATIKGQADAKAIKIYGDAIAQTSDFFEFLRTLEAYKASMDSNTTLVLSTSSDLFKFLKGMSPKDAR